MAINNLMSALASGLMSGDRTAQQPVYANNLYQKSGESLADYYSRLASSRKGGILGEGAAVAGKNIVAPTASPAVSAPSAAGGSADPNQGNNLPNIFNPKTEGRGFITDNNALSTWGQDMALNLMNVPGLTGLLAGLYLDSQMGEMGRQEGVYDDKRYGTGTAIVADENGNLNLVDLSKYSSTPAKGQTTLYSGKTGGGVGNMYTFNDRGRGGLFGGIVDSIFGKPKTTWNDLGGYTGVTGTGTAMGNDWDSFGGDIARTTTPSAKTFPAGQYSDFGFLTGAAKDQEAAERAVSAALATGKDKAAQTPKGVTKGDILYGDDGSLYQKKDNAWTQVGIYTPNAGNVSTWKDVGLTGTNAKYINTWANNGTLSNNGAIALAQYMKANPKAQIAKAMKAVRDQKSGSVDSLLSKINTAVTGGGSSISGDSGISNWSSPSLAAGRGSGAGANPASSISGGSGRTDGGWGW